MSKWMDEKIIHIYADVLDEFVGEVMAFFDDGDEKKLRRSLAKARGYIPADRQHSYQYKAANP
jgi:hypothetical protein